MWEGGCFPATILEQLRRPCRPRHPYAVPRTSLQCVCTRRRNCIAQLSPSHEYALRTVYFPAGNSATIERTHDPHGSGSRRDPVLRIRGGDPCGGKQANCAGSCPWPIPRQAASIAFCADLRLATDLSDQPPIMLDVCVVDKALIRTCSSLRPARARPAFRRRGPRPLPLRPRPLRLHQDLGAALCCP